MFKLVSNYKPTGDQPQAIKKLIEGLENGQREMTLLGVTGSGKTFSIANVIAELKKPTLVISHNKTLAAQTYQELKDFFPENSVHYFVSYYDYYQPEAYLPHTDTYIEKDAKINEEIDRLRHAATQALITRDDVIIVASVSCIYNLGSPEDYKNLSLDIFEGQKISLVETVKSLIRLQYKKDYEIKRGGFRNTKDEIEIFSADGNNLHKIVFNPTGPSPRVLGKNKIFKIYSAKVHHPDDVEFEKPNYQRILEAKIFPAKYWVAPDEKIDIALENIKAELQQTAKELKKEGKGLEAERLSRRTLYDLRLIKETGYCHGIENYSRHLDFRKPGQPPFTLLNFFSTKGGSASGGKTKGDFLTIIDESHITLPQLKGMHRGDKSRKETLIEYGFRLPSALDNRPLHFEEFEERINRVIFLSATPSKYELKKSGRKGLVQQLIRPTGLLDPTIEVRRTKNQVKHLIEEIKRRVARKERILVTTLTKRMAEDMAEYLAENGIKTNYIHSEIKTLDRLEIIKGLRTGQYDVIVGVNLLREGLDLPEVSLIAIFDADKEGFLRNATTLIQTMGRAARHINGHIILYADKTTRSMKAAIEETLRRRKIQEDHNQKNNITPQSIKKAIKDFDLPLPSQISRSKIWEGEKKKEKIYNELSTPASPKAWYDINEMIKQLEKTMTKAVKQLDFETALMIREQILKLKKGL
ncbi:MAG: excinuclease ABC subunit B [Parcubacteria group bacterium Gr01-1014_2]|nr:MAG: excinuclease ABC subunit B [Parcubacteria group bacterium Gr01-1014_2]